MARTGGKRGDERKKMAEQEERIRELEEKLARLEAQERGGESGGTAASILQGLGGMFPGLDRIIASLEKSEAFRERLKAIDAEIESRFRSEPLKRVEVGGTMSSLRSRPTGRPMARRPPLGRRQAPVAESEVPTVEEPAADVFDEETHLKAVVELPGVEEKVIKADLTGDRLVISVDTLARQYRKEIVLPYAPKGKVERLYRNGILELMLWKE
ncbi:MAG: Hsp20/alpha crystallin family protein [Thermoplasmata archaeon]